MWISQTIIACLRINMSLKEITQTFLNIHHVRKSETSRRQIKLYAFSSRRIGCYVDWGSSAFFQKLFRNLNLFCLFALIYAQKCAAVTSHMEIFHITLIKEVCQDLVFPLKHTESGCCLLSGVIYFTSNWTFLHLPRAPFPVTLASSRLLKQTFAPQNAWVIFFKYI